MPNGAAPILAARKQGKKPADLIILSMLGSLPNELNPVVQVTQSVNYDWGWLRGLQACFWVTPDTYQAKHIIDASKALPARLYLWDCANEKGFDLWVFPTDDSIDRPREQWILKVDRLRWMPFQEKKFAQGELTWN